MRYRLAILSLSILAFVSCSKKREAEATYRADMRNFVIRLSEYSKSIKPGFLVIPQNGHQLIFEGEENTESSDAASLYLNSIDAIAREDLYYGWDADDKATPYEENLGMLTHLNTAKSHGKKILVTDYCSSEQKISDSYQKNQSAGFISFAADSRDLDKVPSSPSQPFNSNNDSVLNLTQAKNFLYLLNASHFTDKQSFIQSIQAENYDVIIMDYSFSDGTPFTASEIAALKKKPNGAPRLVISYLSIGEAEDYRYYWQNFWRTNPPAFLAAENTAWSGNYRVRYWDKSWQSIIYGNSHSYVKKIIDAGFDGCYLDIIDGFEYFEGLNGR